MLSILRSTGTFLNTHSRLTVTVFTCYFFHNRVLYILFIFYFFEWGIDKNQTGKVFKLPFCGLNKTLTYIFGKVSQPCNKSTKLCRNQYTLAFWEGILHKGVF
jgi:hypothetical protein